MNEYEEGGECPCCNCNGVLEIHNERGCTCFIVAPCSGCVDSVLKCDDCGWETDSGWFGDIETDAVESQVMKF